MFAEKINDISSRLAHVQECRKLHQFARKTGMPYEWMKKFLAGDIANPGWKTMDKLETALDLWYTTFEE